MKRALTIAGSDSGGGAGIQADLKTFSALGVYGMSALTSITAQNTLGVQGVYDLPAELVGLQIDSVVSDIGVDVVKTGMLSNSQIIEVVAAKVREHGLRPLVIDPVMVAKSGDPLLRPEAMQALREELLPLATVITPNLHEASRLLDRPVEDLPAMQEAARRLQEMGPQVVVVKGGHLEGEAVDVVFDGRRLTLLSGPRVETEHSHGTGCTFASAIAAHLARGSDHLEAIRQAKAFVTMALRHAPGLGGGHGPTHHFAHWWEGAELPKVELREPV